MSPYLPVESYEVGNEPDLTAGTAPTNQVQYVNPADYSVVYAATRAALHDVDPAAQVVVGGMLDGGPTPVSYVERYLTAIGPADAIGFGRGYFRTSCQESLRYRRCWSCLMWCFQ